MKEKNKILIFTGNFPPDIGGPATQLDALSQALIKRGFKIRILAFGQEDEIDYSYPVKRISRKYPAFLRFLLFFINGFSWGLNSDILYAQDLYIPGFSALVVKKLTGRYLVTRFVGDSAWETALNQGVTDDDIITFQDKKYSWAIELRKKIRKSILINSDKVIVVSNFLKTLARKIGLAEEQIKLIYNSVDFLDQGVKESRDKLRKKLGWQGIVLLSIGRLAPWKGLGTLIEIMPQLVKKYHQIRLIIAGEGGEKSYLEKLIQALRLENHVFLVGKLNRNEVIEYLKAADLFLLNSAYEGMSHVLLEAMKTGLPIIASRAGGNPETIRDEQTGLLVDYNRQEQWLAAISRLLDDSGLRNRLARQAKNDLKRFSWANLVEETINLFKNV